MSRGLTTIASEWFETIESAESAGYQCPPALRSSTYNQVAAYPWNGMAVPVDGDQQHRRRIYTRNRNLFTVEEMEVLGEAEVLIAGLSVGSSSVESMIRLGFSHFTLVDDDQIADDNLNRLVGSSLLDVGLDKVQWAARRILELNPYATVRVLNGRVDSALLEPGSELSSLAPIVVVDAVDDLTAKLDLRLFAQRTSAVLLMATDAGFRSIIDCEDYRVPSTVPFDGRLSDELIQALAERRQDKFAEAMIELVGRENIGVRLLTSFQATMAGDLPGIPQLGPVAATGGALCALRAAQAVLGRLATDRREIGLLDIEPGDETNPGPPNIAT